MCVAERTYSPLKTTPVAVIAALQTKWPWLAASEGPASAGRVTSDRTPAGWLLRSCAAAFVAKVSARAPNTLYDSLGVRCIMILLCNWRRAELKNPTYRERRSCEFLMQIRETPWWPITHWTQAGSGPTL